MKNRTTSENIADLKDDQVFVFGSNLSGIHGAGAARLAMDRFGARYGQGVGLAGKTFAIPTKSKGIKRTLTVKEIKPYVDLFILYAKKNPVFIFLVTEIGCGLAGHKVEDIAPLFAEAINVTNIHLPERFWNVLSNKTE
jgi:hypothetical protein